MSKTHRVEHRRRDLSFVGSPISHVHGSHFASMTALLLSSSQLDRTRQPGFAQADASWCAPVGVATRAGNASKLLEGTIEHERARFAPENDNLVQRPDSEVALLRVHLRSSRGSETNAPPAPDAGGAFCIWALFENSYFSVRPRRMTLE